MYDILFLGAWKKIFNQSLVGEVEISKRFTRDLAEHEWNEYFRETLSKIFLKN